MRGEREDDVDGDAEADAEAQDELLGGRKVSQLAVIAASLVARSSRATASACWFDCV